MKSFIVAITLLLSACATAVPMDKVVSVETECAPRMTLDYWGVVWRITEWRALPEDQRVEFLSWFNSQPPVSDYNPKFVYLVKFGGGPNVAAVFHDGKCVTLINTFKEGEVERRGA